MRSVTPFTVSAVVLRAAGNVGGGAVLNLTVHPDVPLPDSFPQMFSIFAASNAEALDLLGRTVAVIVTDEEVSA